MASIAHILISVGVFFGIVSIVGCLVMQSMECLANIPATAESMRAKRITLIASILVSAVMFMLF